MRNIKQIVKSSSFLLGALGVIALVAGFFSVVNSATLYPAGSMLQPNDVTSSHIRQGVILDEDISPSASISARKITTLGTGGTPLLTDGTKIATTTKILFATSTDNYYFFGGRVHATSTNLNGVDLTWPSTGGTAGYFLSTNGVDTLSWSVPAAGLLTTAVTAGENLTLGEAVFINRGITATSTAEIIDTAGVNSVRIGDISGRTKQAQEFKLGNAGVVNRLLFNLAKTGTPTDNAKFSIQADSAGSPSGTELATITLAGSSVTGSEVAYYKDFSTGVQIPANTSYWIVAERSGAIDASHYYDLGTNIAAPYATGTPKIYDGAAWGAGAVDHELTLYTTYRDSKAYRTSAANTYSAESFVGFVSDASITSGNSGNIVAGGLASNFTGLMAGMPYYLGNASSTLSIVAGTVTKKIGVAMSTTTLMITNNF